MSILAFMRSSLALLSSLFLFVYQTNERTNTVYTLPFTHFVHNCKQLSLAFAISNALVKLNNLKGFLGALCFIIFHFHAEPCHARIIVVVVIFALFYCFPFVFLAYSTIECIMSYMRASSITRSFLLPFIVTAKRE